MKFALLVDYGITVRIISVPVTSVPFIDEYLFSIIQFFMEKYFG